MTKRLWTLPVLAAFLIAAGTGAGFAMPSLGGPTGIVSVPTAAIAPSGDLQLALGYQSLQAAGMYDFNVWSFQALTGITDEAELWAAYSTVRNGEDSNMWGIGGKVQLTKEPEDTTALAIGASYESLADAPSFLVAAVPTGTADVSFFKAYVVATKDLTPMGGESWEWGPGAGTRILGTVGIMYMKVDPDGADSESMTRPFLGLEFVGAGGSTLGLEYRWKDDNIDQKAVFSAVLRHPFSEDWEAEVGTTNAGPAGIGLDDQDFFVRIGYTVPMGGAL